jgi:hypothetical protein
VRSKPGRLEGGSIYYYFLKKLTLFFRRDIFFRENASNDEPGELPNLLPVARIHLSTRTQDKNKVGAENLGNG